MQPILQAGRKRVFLTRKTHLGQAQNGENIGPTRSQSQFIGTP